MENIVTEIEKIVKKSATQIHREKAVWLYVVTVICECIRLAFEQLDEEMAEIYKLKGFRIKRRDQQTIHFLFGSVTYKRRRMAQKGQPGSYPLDQELGFVKHQRYSTLVLNTIAELATKSVYRHVAQVVDLLTSLSISHQKVNQLVIQVGDYCEAYETQQEEIERPIDRKKCLLIIYRERNRKRQKIRASPHSSSAETTKGLGTCESNHRQYTYRMKRQGRIWSSHGLKAWWKSSMPSVTVS